MSGGHFDYKQNHIRQIYESIESELDRQGLTAPNALYFSNKELLEHPKYGVYEIYPEKVQQIMKDAIKILKQAEIYSQRIDWYLSGDDGEESLYKRLEEDLNKIK